MTFVPSLLNDDMQRRLTALRRGLVPQTTRHALLLFFLFVVAFSSPYWAMRQVIIPYPILQAKGAPDPDSAAVTRFSDYYNGFIPEVDDLLNGNRSSWIKLWSDETELGRPTYHTSGYSPIFAPGFIIGLLTHDPFVYLTILSWFIVVMFGLFVLLLTREWGGSPTTALLLGVLALGLPYMMLWMTFAVFISSFCWVVGIMYAFESLRRRPTFWYWLLLVFCASSLLLTAYPQTMVYAIYMVVGYGITVIIPLLRHDFRHGLRFTGTVASALAVAVALSAPMYLDILVNANDSVRVNAGYEFFSAASRYPSTIGQVIRMIARYQYPDFYGFPLTQGATVPYSGENFTPILSALVTVGFLAAWRKNRYWIACVLVLVTVMYCPPLHEFLVMHLGFNLSRSEPMGFAKQPMLFIAINGAIALFDMPRDTKFFRTLLVAGAVQFALMVLLIANGMSRGASIAWVTVAVTLFCVGAVFLVAVRPVPFLLSIAVGLTMVYYAVPLMLRGPNTQSFPAMNMFVQIRKLLPAGSRTAVIPGNIPFVGNNLNAYLDIPSIHTYNSLAPARYSQLITTLGGKVIMYGRRNASINPAFDSEAYWMSNIGLLFTNSTNVSPQLKKLATIPLPGRMPYVYVYASPARMGTAIVVPIPAGNTQQRDITIPDPRLGTYETPVQERDADDELIFQIHPSAPSLLVISQKYHPQWRVEVERVGTWTAAPSLVVNGFFQGVPVQPGDTRVRLRFEPYARFALASLLYWPVAVSAWYGGVLYRRRKHIPIASV